MIEGQGDQSPPFGARAPHPYRSARGRANVVVVLLALNVVLAVASIVTGGYALGLVQNLREGQAVSRAAAAASDTRLLVLSVAQAVLFALTGAAWLVWQHLAQANLPPDGRRFTPRWAVAWWFVPVANLWKPYQSMRELWRESSRGGDEREGVVTWWWAAFVSMVVLDRLLLASPGRAMGRITAPSWAHLGADVLTLVASVLAAVLVRGVVRRQERSLPVASWRGATSAPEGDAERTRKGLRAAAAVTAVLALTGAVTAASFAAGWNPREEPGEGTGTFPPLPAGWNVHERPRAGFALGLPANWRLRRSDDREVSLAATAPERGGRPGARLDVIDLPLPSEVPLGAAVTGLVKQYRREGLRPTHQSVRLPAGEAERIVLRDPSSPRVTLVQYLLVQGRRGYLVTFETRNPGAHASLFSRILQQFQVRR